MIGLNVVVVVLLVLVGALVVGLALLTSHGLALAVRERATAGQLRDARTALVRLLIGGDDRSEDSAVVARLSRRTSLRLLGELTPSVAGAQRARITELARAAGLLDAAARACRSRRWKRRLRGARTFTLLGGGHDSVWVLFDDRRAEVRAQAAEWAADHPRPEVVERLLDLLGDPQTLCRFTVRDSLLRIGRPAVPALVARLATASGSDAQPALAVGVWLADARLLGPALRLAGDADAGVRALSARLLGSLGGKEATTTVVTLLDDPEIEVRAAAAAAVGKAHHWPAASRLSELLRDPAWDVRRAAGHALLALGAPGQLLLRRALGDRDRFAGDMARLVLGLPDRMAVAS